MAFFKSIAASTVRRLFFIPTLCCGFLLVVACSKQASTSYESKEVLSDAQQSLSLDAADAVSLGQYAAVTPNGYGAVASVNPLATQAGLDAFANGGNAVDAAIAVALTLGVVDSHNSGIGGGCFILLRTAKGEVIALDAREMAPNAAHRDMYIINGELNKALSKTGALAVGIPGSLLGYEQLANKWGKLPFNHAFTHGIKHARDGFKVDKVLAARIKRTAPKIAKFNETAGIFLTANGEPYQQGERLVQSDLADTYSNIVSEGTAYFYGGAFAKQVETWMQQNGGIVTANDFKNYELKSRKPVVSSFNGYTVYGFPPPSSGGVHVSQILNTVESLNIGALPKSDRYHVLAESMKLAFADRAHWMGDPDYTKVPTGLYSDEYAQALAKTINLKQAQDVKAYGTPTDSETNFFEQLNKHTTHIAAADKDGNWVAITTTLNTSFGSKVIVPGTGVLLNNQMDDFSADVGQPNAFGLIGAKANSIEAGKRPLSSMSPTIIEQNGQPILTLGAAGGPTIINQVVQVVLNNLVLDMPLDEAIAQGRIHHQWRPDRVVVEGKVAKDVVEALEDRGHNVKQWRSFGATQAIKLENKQFYSVSEPRIQ